MRRILALSPLALLLLFALGACASDASSNIGKYHRGRYLDVAVSSIERVPVLRYSTIDPNNVIKHWKLEPTDNDNELTLIRVKVENHTATSALFDVGSDSAELRDFASQEYQPLNISERVEETPDPPGRDGKSVVFVWGPFELPKGTGIDGWLVFETPKEAKFRDFRWTAGDSLTIPF